MYITQLHTNEVASNRKVPTSVDLCSKLEGASMNAEDEKEREICADTYAPIARNVSKRTA